LLIAKYYKIKILKAVSFKILIIASILIIVLLVSALIYEALLKYLIQRDRMIDLTKNEKLYALQKELGPKI
jgi:ethanolamine transporter EutH